MAERVRSRGVPVGLFFLAILGSAMVFSARSVAAPHPFLRGDAETNGDINITDAIRILNFLFRGFPEDLPCFDAADTDDSGDLAITDGIFLLAFLFQGGAPPPAPYPDCDIDTTADEIDCQAFRGCPQAFRISLGDIVSEDSPDFGAGRVEKPGSRDFYIFSAEPGQFVFFDELETEDCDLRMRVVNRLGRTVVFDPLCGADAGARVLELGGDHAVRVVNSGEGGPGLYSFQVREIPDGGRFEISIGDTVAPGVPAEGAGVLEEPGVIDLYFFDAEPGQEVFFAEPEAAEGDLRWRLTDAEGRVLFFAPLNGQDPGVRVLELGGRYQIEVYSPANDVGNFAFQLLDVSAADVFDIAIGDTIADGVPGPGAGNIEAPGSIDIYRFDAAPGQVIYIRSLMNFSPGRQELLDEEGNRIFFSGVNGDRASTLLERGGRYELRVNALGDATGVYSLEILEVPPPDEFELSLGDSVSDGVPAAGAGRIESPDARDIYQFNVAPGQAAYFREIEGSGSLRWELFDAEDVRVFFDPLNGNDLGLVLLDRGGSYRLEVHAISGVTGTYAFELLDVPPPDRFDIAIGDTISDGVPGPGAGNIETPGRQDIYRFTAAAGETVDFRELVALPGGTWELFDDSDTRVFSDPLNGNDRGPTRLERGGTYEIRVRGNGATTGSYSFEIAPVP